MIKPIVVVVWLLVLHGTVSEKSQSSVDSHNYPSEEACMRVKRVIDKTTKSVNEYLNRSTSCVKTEVILND